MSTPDQLLSALDYDSASKFPAEAIREIVSRREEMTPVLLEVLEACRADPSDFNDSARCMLPTYAAFLLAQFRETRAYRPIIALLQLDAEVADAMFGDSLTEDLKDVLACVFDGDEAPLRGLIENPKANEWARGSAGLRAYTGLIHMGKISRDEVERYFADLLESRLEREPSPVWDNLASLSGDLGFAPLLPLVRRAHEDGLCDPWFASLEGIETNMKAGGNPRWSKDCTPIDDVVALMENWACFNIPPARSKPPRETESMELIQMLRDVPGGAREYPSRPTIPPPPLYPGVTRNDPCPCGSGKKFKKCCGAR